MAKKKTVDPIVHKHTSFVKTVSGKEKEIIDLIFIFNLVGNTCILEDRRGMIFTDLKIIGYEAAQMNIIVNGETQQCLIPIKILSECGRNFALHMVRNITVVGKGEEVK